VVWKKLSVVSRVRKTPEALKFEADHDISVGVYVSTNHRSSEFDTPRMIWGVI
jgi:hypothetical protein